MALLPLYEVIIEYAPGKYVQMHRFSSLKYGYSLNRGTTAELVMPMNSTKLDSLTTATLNSWIRIYRWDNAEDQGTKRLVWYGLLTDISYGLDENSGKVTMRYSDIAMLLSHRRVPRTYSVATPTDASQILWELIDDSQSIMVGSDVVGSLGITQGSLAVSKDRQPQKDLQNRTILEVLQAFSEYEDGIDWEITPTPKTQEIGIFNTYYTTAGSQYHKGNVVATPLTYYVDESNDTQYNNVKTADVSELGSDYANDILALGSTLEEVQLFSIAENESQQLVYGLFQDVVSETSISEQETLDDKAGEELNARASIPYNIKLTMMPLQQPRFGTFDVGDIFTFRFRFYNFRNFSSRYRLYRLTVNVDDSGVEKMDLELNNI